MNKLKLIFASMLVLSFAFLTVPAYADETAQGAVCNGIGLVATSGNCTGDDNSPTVPGVVHSAISILSYVIGIAGIIMVIVGGFKYVTAGGDSNRVGSAKSTIIYALTGLVIAALAQVLVLFVFTNATNSPSNTPPAGCQSNTQCPDTR
jgi:uncharacterized membrane protein YuzA (DUF378 family)